jgi:predicted transcriptional regulator
MADNATLTVRLPTRFKAQLAELAAATRRSGSFLAAASIAEYVAREMAIVAAIEHGREDARAGRMMPHDPVMREARVVIEEARTKP